ncbi:chemotaxis response regulator protein-glutamate methylesterase [bacterium BMS3Bbin10]|nr:chemotaxis response regulator protein-glutamate methylesterase [bacterium BMS3Bbin10]
MMTSLAPLQARPASATPAKIRVMVVDDSAVVRGLVSRWVDEDPGMETIGRFANGQLALDGIAGCAPDVVVLDIEMPVMDGMTALPELLKLKPGVKIIMSSTLTRKNAEISMKALSLGATDYIPKPESNRGVTTSVDFRTALLDKIKALVPRKAARAPVAPNSVSATRQPVEAGAPGVSPAAPAGESPALRTFSRIKPRILAIGSSTGGPQALARVIEDVASATADIPVVITQHMPPTFTAILAEHLARSAGRTAKEGTDGEKIIPGTIYVAPGGLHMTVIEKDGAPALSVYDGPMVNFCKPAVDPMFEGVVKVYGPAVLALVLTGMGHDGAKGAVQIADTGGAVIAQDEATSVVWGMPGAAVVAGACAAILPLDEIGRKISDVLRGVVS